MALPEPFRDFVEPLEAAGLDYCVTGSLAAGLYGEPRVTRGIDLLLLLQIADLARLRVAFPEESFYLPPMEVMVTEVLRGQRGSFLIIQSSGAFKADVYLVSRDPLHHWALQHRRREKLGVGELWLAPPEYVILRKLEFFREGAQEKHLRDVRFMLAVTAVDSTFLQQEVQRLGLGAPWQTCLQEGGHA